MGTSGHLWAALGDIKDASRINPSDSEIRKERHLLEQMLRPAGRGGHGVRMGGREFDVPFDVPEDIVH